MSKLRDYRQQAGYKQSAFVEKLRELPDFKNCTVGALSRWENGSLLMPLHKWAQILKLLGKTYEPMTEVLGEKAPPVSAQAAADGVDPFKLLAAELGKEFSGKLSARVGYSPENAHAESFAHALREVKESGKAVHVPSFEKGWNAAVEHLQSEDDIV